MDFFEHQRLARRNSRLMVVLFLMAVAGVVIAVDAVISIVYLWNYSDFKAPLDRRPGLAGLLGVVPAEVYLWASVLTAGLILCVSVFNVLRLGGGGTAVAKMLGARRLSPASADPSERRLLNVVEEMAIASGVRMPAAYVMDGEPGINAFAAGYEVSNSVVVVTRGTLETLTRDELQGVIGHEFSHILNGDMRLNLRMLGVLAGILFIGSIGRFLMRSASSSRSGRGGNGLPLIGLGLFIVGYSGLFFGRLIKAAVSRQREFLADASSVQFTRNPDGIAGALDQIRTASAVVSNRYAEEMAHMFFAQAIPVWLAGLFATHPPIEERIRRIAPGFQPTRYRSRRGAAREEAPPAGAVAGVQAFGRRAGDLGIAWGRSAGESAMLVGTLDAQNVDLASRLLAAVPQGLHRPLRDPLDACLVPVALMLAPDQGMMRVQLEAVRAAGLGAVAERVQGMVDLTRPLGIAFHLPLIDIALPAIKEASEEARRELLVALEAVIHADRRVTLHEFAVLSLLRSQLEPRAKPSAAGSRKLAELREAALVVLALVAQAGVGAESGAARDQALQAAFAAGLREMGIEGAAPAPEKLTLGNADEALRALHELAPLQKALLVKGLFAAATVDGRIRVGEAELMRLVGAVLDCPLPPLLESLDPTALDA